ncbi:hypothetical protein AB3M83_07285 [Microbacterium sp. 179-B 1A2 NHS]|uniref:hypothetical protein n=1 Tax=Microbacterium sp. 179-B 1A2 NHS TaxID=3142383 RepID=UPI0039A0D2DA
MLIVLALVIGATLGAAAHFAVSGRDLRGAALGPLSGTALGALGWMILTWAGQGPDSLWTWLATILLPAIVVPIALVLLTRARVAHDERTRRELGIA